ncbi:MAG: pyridoxal phosphate-dependent aminotransferase family protein [Planctomycetota bacterium]|nr:pyridoxal phosphate-dependent aminotransferase family protein [Planctomycetota bacterium]
MAKSKLFPTHPGAKPMDPCGGFFTDGRALAAANGSLLSLSPVRRMFEFIREGFERDVYTYQQALDGRSGPRVQVGGSQFLMLSSCDYLGLIGHPAIEEAAVRAVRDYGTGTGGVRLLSGTAEIHRSLEATIASFKGTEAAATFSSCYLANFAVMAALFGPRDRALVDSLAHRSIVDACTLARVPVHRFAHNDLASLEEMLQESKPGQRTVIILDGVYSMEGDICPLPGLVDLKRRYGAFLMVDEAHSVGVLGPTGSGTHEHFGMEPGDVDIWTGSLSKAIPANGGFVAGSKELVLYLQHDSAPYVFSAALAPASAAAAVASFDVILREPERLDRLRCNADLLRDGLRDLGYDTGSSATPIIPVILGRRWEALTLARRLLASGILASPIVSPAVPRTRTRLRLCAMANHSELDIEEALSAFESARGWIEEK